MLEKGFRYGLGYNGQRKFHTSPNLQSASQHPNIVDQKLAKEIAQNRIACPFRESISQFTNFSYWSGTKKGGGTVQINTSFILSFWLFSQ